MVLHDDPKGIANHTSIANPRDRRFYRGLEILPALWAWGTILGCVVFSFIYPVGVAIFIIIFDLHWLLKVSYLCVHQVSSYFHYKRHLRINWLLKCKRYRGDKSWRQLYHLVIIPTYKENLDVLETTFKALVDSDYPQKRMIAVLGVEERDRVNGLHHAEALRRKFGRLFFHFFVTIHPQDIVGELAGKGSNETWAGRQIQEWLDQKRIPYDDVVVSVFDADTCVHPKYFSCLTYHYLRTSQRTRASFQPIPMFNNNIWDSPSLMRVASASTTFWHMMEQERPERMGTFSSHAMSFQAVVEIGFWQTNIVSEDSRIFYQCLFHYHGDYAVVPLFMPISMDTVLGSTFWQSLVNQYKQRRRWGWGVENLPYVIYRSFKTRGMHWRRKLTVIYREVEGKYSWAVTAIILMSVGWLPVIFGGDAFRETVLARNLPYVTRYLMTLSMIGIFVSSIIATVLLPPRPRHQHRFKYFSMVFQWILLPVVTIVFGSVAALDAQTRLAFKKYMGFLVTPKPRKSKAENIKDAQAHSSALFKQV